jgi:hypothetical protein
MHCLKFIGVLCGVPLCAFAVMAKPPLPLGAQEVFMLGYESAENLASVRSTMTAKSSPSALKVDCSVARSGKCSVMASIEENSVSVSAGAYRAESDTMKLLQTRYGAGDTLLYRFSLKLPADWETQPRSSIDIVWQFKRFDGQPDMFVAVKGNALVLRVGATAQVTLLESLPLGRWLDLDLKVHWSNRPDGKVEGTVSAESDAVLHHFEYAGATARNDKPNAGYLKWGLYKPGKTDRSMQFQPRSVWHDEIHVYKLN